MAMAMATVMVMVMVMVMWCYGDKPTIYYPEYQLSVYL